MAGLPNCDRCPFRDDPDTPCAVLSTNHVRFCEAIDPASPTYRPNMRRGLVRLTNDLLGRPTTDEPPPSYPPLLTRAGNLAGAVVAAVASGGKQVTPEQRAERLSICRGCEHFVADGVKCRRCGCGLALKTRLEAWHCPLDPPKW